MSKLRLMVCPHDTAKDPEKWYLFAQYVSLGLNLEVAFDIAMDFNAFHDKMQEADIIYANPRDTLRLTEEMGFSSLVRPDNRYDEVVFIANNDVDEPQLGDLHGETIATVKSMLPTNIALHLLKKESVEPDGLRDKNSWLSVINCVRRKETNFGFVYKDTYDDLSNLSKIMINTFHVSHEQLAFHSVNIGPQSNGMSDDLKTLLLDMEANPKGAEVLAKLGVPKWLPVTKPEIQGVRKVVDEYT